MNFLSVADLPLTNKRVLIRVDFNVPMKNGSIICFSRIDAALPTIKYALKEKAYVILISHLGRPIEGRSDKKYSLSPILEYLSEKLNISVKFTEDYLSGIEVNHSSLIMCENVRFNKGETKSDTILSKKLAQLCDIFVMDAFSVAHRVHASTYGIVKHAPVSCVGFSLEEELRSLSFSLKMPNPPLVAIIGGSKVSTKLSLLENLISKANQLILGGGIANTFLAASGFNVGKSLIEKDLIKAAARLMDKAKSAGSEFLLPNDVRVSKSLGKHCEAEIKSLEDIEYNDMILDIGPLTESNLKDSIFRANTILWNGPMGVFELSQFELGTKAIALSIADSNSFSVAGGGETVAAIQKFKIRKKLSYVSNAGGAFLKFIESNTLPCIDLLKNYAKVVKKV